MHVQNIRLSNFMVYDKTTVELPPKGLVTVVGVNGEGKSTLLEGVAATCWGRTLRGTEPWNTAKDALASVEMVDGLTVTRKRKAGKGSSSVLSFLEKGKKPVAYATATKAQDALNLLLGDFSVWSRTHVFSSADAFHFSLATDAERKRLLEAVLGLDAFDDALDAVRVECRKTDAVLADAVRQFETTEAMLGQEIRRVEEARAALAKQPPAVDMEALRAQLTSTKALLESNRATYAKLNTTRNEAGAQVSEAAMQARQAALQLDRLDVSKCPTCAQPIPETLRSRLRLDAAEAKAKVDAAKASTAKACAEVDGEIEELQEEFTALNQKAGTLSSEGRSASAFVSSRKQFQELVDASESRLSSLGAQLNELKDADARERVELATWKACEQVLGLKGVRASILARLLSTLEAAANANLRQVMGREMSLKLTPYTERKSGSISDAIGLQVEGAGGGHGYKAASQGERRRIDFAILLALAEVAAGVRGQEPGTLFFDEVFDSLDAQGVVAVSSVLARIAGERAVVVITHSEDLAKQLHGTRFRVEHGSVVRY
jgi:exonuclease SbcC